MSFHLGDINLVKLTLTQVYNFTDVISSENQIWKNGYAKGVWSLNWGLYQFASHVPADQKLLCGACSEALVVTAASMGWSWGRIYTECLSHFSSCIACLMGPMDPMQACVLEMLSTHKSYSGIWEQSLTEIRESSANAVPEALWGSFPLSISHGHSWSWVTAFMGLFGVLLGFPEITNNSQWLRWVKLVHERDS